jgi:hypothetical protein
MPLPTFIFVTNWQLIGKHQDALPSLSRKVELPAVRREPPVGPPKAQAAAKTLRQKD